MRGKIDFRFVYRRDQFAPVAQYRFEYYTEHPKGWLRLFKRRETIMGKWVDMDKTDAVYIPLIKSFQQY